MVQSHRLRRKLRAGEPVTGAIVNVQAPWFIDLVGISGFDFVMLDAEHGPITPENVELMIRAAEQAGMTALVRVPANVPHVILGFLDAGAQAIQVPHIQTADDAPSKPHPGMIMQAMAETGIGPRDAAMMRRRAADSAGRSMLTMVRQRMRGMTSCPTFALRGGRRTSRAGWVLWRVPAAPVEGEARGSAISAMPERFRAMRFSACLFHSIGSLGSIPACSFHQARGVYGRGKGAWTDWRGMIDGGVKKRLGSGEGGVPLSCKI